MLSTVCVALLALSAPLAAKARSQEIAGGTLTAAGEFQSLETTAASAHVAVNGDEMAVSLEDHPGRNLLARCVRGCRGSRRMRRRRGSSRSFASGGGGGGGGFIVGKTRSHSSRKRSSPKRKSGGKKKGGSKKRGGSKRKPAPKMKKRSAPKKKASAPKKGGKKSGGSKPPPKTSGGGGGGGGEYVVCLKGQSQRFGLKNPQYKNRPDGLVITADGKCKFDEYAGGFDGFWSVNAGDSHEIGMATAVKQALNVGNGPASAFLKKLKDMVKPVDLEFPEEKAKADGGVRASNIKKLNAACSKLITVKRC